MDTIESNVAMRKSLTGPQADAVQLRCERGASIREISDWLGISERAVLYRLRNARRRGARVDPSNSSMPKESVAARIPHKPRFYAISQLDEEHRGQTFSMDRI